MKARERECGKEGESRGELSPISIIDLGDRSFCGYR